MSKKKGGAKKGKAAGEEEDLSTEELLRAYRRHCAKHGINTLKSIEERFVELFDEGEDLTKIRIYDEVGPLGVRAFCDALYEVKYKHLKVICYWKAKAKDEGIRATAEYLKLPTTEVSIIDFLYNDITPLGCQFLGDVLPSSKITMIKLDHNPFGSKGLEQLAKGLCKNPTVVSLSLSYCEIDAEGAKYLQQILAFIKSELKSLDISGNNLQNEGVINIFKALEINNMLEVLNLCDNKFGEDPNLINKTCDLFEKNKALGVLQIDYNGIYDEGAKKFLDKLSVVGNKSLYKLELPSNVNRDIITEIATVLKKNAPKGKKKKKKK